MTTNAARARTHIAENSLPGLRPRNRTSRRGLALAKSNRASGMRARVRPEGVGDSCHRWYEQQTGRYTSSDPLVLLPGLYVYALANPLYWIDPKGLAPSCKGTWKVWDWWLLGDMRSVAPEGAPQIAPPSANSNKIPGGHSRPGGGGRGGGRDFNFIPPGVCFCSWNCKPCKGPSMFDANALPVTRGKTIHSGSDISGDFCICFNKPSIEEPCPKDPVCEVFPDLGAAVSSPDYTP